LLFCSLAQKSLVYGEMSAREMDVARGMALANNFKESINGVLLSSTVKASVGIKQLELLSRLSHYLEACWSD